MSRARAAGLAAADRSIHIADWRKPQNSLMKVASFAVAKQHVRLFAMAKSRPTGRPVIAMTRRDGIASTLGGEVMTNRAVPLVVAIILVTAPVAHAGAPIYHGELRVARAGKGRISLETGQASFGVRDWQFLPSADSNGIDPATDDVVIGVAEERFLIPGGQMRVSRNGKRFVYKEKTDRGIQLLKLIRTSTGSLKTTLKLSGVDLSRLLIADPPLCLSFALIVGDDDGFTGVSFDRPKPFPSKLLTLPGFCTENTEWPWA